MSEILKLDKKDFLKGILTAILSAVFIAVYKIVNAPGFDLFTVDWNIVLHAATNAAAGAFLGDISRRFFTDDSGDFLAGVPKRALGRMVNVFRQ